jgi:hypothetical protein
MYPVAHAQEEETWTQIEYGQSLEETLTGGFDGYYFYGSRGDRVVITASSDTLQLELSFYMGSNELARQSSTEGVCQISAELPEATETDATIYYIIITGATPITVEGSYQLALELEPPALATEELKPQEVQHIGLESATLEETSPGSGVARFEEPQLEDIQINSEQEWDAETAQQELQAVLADDTARTLHQRAAEQAFTEVVAGAQALSSAVYADQTRRERQVSVFMLYDEVNEQSIALVNVSDQGNSTSMLMWLEGTMLHISGEDGEHEVDLSGVVSSESQSWLIPAGFYPQPAGRVLADHPQSAGRLQQVDHPRPCKTGRWEEVEECNGAPLEASSWACPGAYTTMLGACACFAFGSGPLVVVGCPMAMAVAISLCPRLGYCMWNMGDDPPVPDEYEYKELPGEGRANACYTLNGQVGTLAYWKMYQVTLTLKDDRQPFDQAEHEVKLLAGETYVGGQAEDCGQNLFHFDLSAPPLGNNDWRYCPWGCTEGQGCNSEASAGQQPADQETRTVTGSFDPSWFEGFTVLENTIYMTYPTAGGPVQDALGTVHITRLWPGCDEKSLTDDLTFSFAFTGTFKAETGQFGGPMQAVLTGDAITDCDVTPDQRMTIGGEWQATLGVVGHVVGTIKTTFHPGEEPSTAQFTLR